MSDSDTDEVVNKIMDKGNKGASELEKQKSDGRRNQGLKNRLKLQIS